MKRTKKPRRPVCILDIETDPFKYGRVPVPFVVGLLLPDGAYRYFWGDSCITDSVLFLAKQEEKWIIYAHNGGKFDYMYYLSHISGNLRIINGRIVSASMAGHEIRDSYAIMPFPLRNYKKDEIDYWKMEAECRELHKAEILDYLHGDCVYLRDLVIRFHELFGQSKLTVGSTSMREIRRRHPFERTTLAFDRVFRPKFYFGGRVQCFKTGIIEGDLELYDVSSSYPASMRNALHPSGSEYLIGDEITDDTCFIVASGKNAGAFPTRNAENGIDFSRRDGTYFITRHEWNTAIATGTFRPERIWETYDFPLRISNDVFVDDFYLFKQEAKKLGNFIDELLYKFVLNSGYGKYAQNPCNFYDWSLASLKDRPRELCRHCYGRGQCRGCFKCQALNDHREVPDRMCMFCLGSGMRWMLHEFDSNNPNGLMLWKARVFQQQFYNVATGASITGASRAILLNGLAQCDRPLYCDTDSIICDGEFRGNINPYELGAWKHEGSGDVAAIAGKKLYCIFSRKKPQLSDEQARKYPWMLESVRWHGRNLWPVKKAHKGFKLSPAQIMHIANGWEIEVANDAPTFSMFREPTFIKRTARMTASA